MSHCEIKLDLDPLGLKYVCNPAPDTYKMKGSLALVLLAVVGAVKARNSVNGTIEEEDRTWFLSNLSVRPAVRATIEYDIWYPVPEYYEIYYDLPYITLYYTGQNTLDLRAGCKFDTKSYGQLYNKDLAILLHEDYRDKYFCKSTFATFVNSRGRIEIQDFEPKTYFFSLGFECGYQSSLDCFQYNVTIYDESNTTRCVDLNITSKHSDMSQQSLIDQCKASYQYAAIPNQVGDTDLDEAMSTLERLNWELSLATFSKQCLIKLWPFVCMIVLPKCLPKEDKIILPCRDHCKFYLKGCLNFRRDAFVNCDYLPLCEGRNSVSGIITDNTKWFLSNLSVRPAMRASLEYSIQYPYVEGRARPIITFYYNGQNSTNLHNKCTEKFMHRQLHNKDLVIPLYDKYRENFRCNDKDGLFKECHGRIDIQDFEPKSYFFSLGFECNKRKRNLNGLYYEVTIYDESNETRCVDLNSTSIYPNMAQKKLIDQCQRSYHYAAIATQFGGLDLDEAMSRLNGLNPLDLTRKQCLKNLKLFLCKIFLLKCLPEENRILLPCRDDCKFYLEGCPSGIVNCDYLPPCEGKTVTGGIEEDTTWFLSNLSVRPAMSASIEYHVQYPDVKGRARPIITFYYNGQDSPNLHAECNSEMHGQLSNKDLAIPLCVRYTEKFWCNRKGWMKVCHGRTKIQDFEPKVYSFSLGFKCNEAKGNLNGLKYDVTIYDESNKTSCVNLNLTQGQRIDLCQLGYQYVAFPNQVGHTGLDEAISYIESFQREFLEGYVQRFNKGCLKKLKPFLCQIFLPRCLPKENKILLPCRDTCKSLLEDCSLSTIYRMEFSCDYLPPCPSTYPNYLIIGLSVGACVILVVMVTVCCLRLRKKISDACWAWLFKQSTLKLKAGIKETDEPLVPRNRVFDAFVLYHFDSDDIYVVDTIIPELEENRNFKLHIHSRDFTPGCDIKDNIEEAIEGSNSAIIVMSQGFVDSKWCKEEFTHCYIENMKDAAFNLFVIVMQPVETLVNISNYMKIFFETKTYLQVDDPELFIKLATHLENARKPVKDNVNNQDETLCHPNEILETIETSV